MSSQPKPTASVYVDGLNLYRRCIQGHPPEKWLNIEALADLLLPEFDVVRVRYFSAVIKTMPGADPRSPQRQQIYLRALATLPRTTIHLGRFRIDPRVMPIHPTEWSADGSPRMVKVKKAEEKGSDVALASYLMLDASRGDSDIHVVCTNDSDLVEPLRLAREQLGRRIGLLSPVEEKRASNELRQTGLELHRRVTIESLQRCQLPDVIDDVHGVITRPTTWCTNSEGPAETGPSNQ